MDKFKVRKLIETNDNLQLILDLEGHNSRIVSTKESESVLTLDGLPTTQEELIAKSKTECLYVVLHPLRLRYGMSLKAEFTTSC